MSEGVGLVLAILAWALLTAVAVWADDRDQRAHDERMAALRARIAVGPEGETR